MSTPLKDNFRRRMDYLRLAVTDRCNLRCQYCMPLHGISFANDSELLTWHEMERICGIFVLAGVQKIRITGGEPFSRPGLVDFLEQLQQFSPKPVIGVTTNGTSLSRYLGRLKDIGVTKINISLDSLRPETFYQITRRDNFQSTLDGIETAYQQGFSLKLNMVVLPGINESEIPEFVRLTRDKSVTVRFIEPMPFNGGDFFTPEPVSGDEILACIRDEFPLKPVGESSSRVATNYKVPGYTGKIGIINGYSRTFCNSCSRIRLSAIGQLRTCLYGGNVLDLKSMLRNGFDDHQIEEAIREALQHRYKTGFESEANRNTVQSESMAEIGG